MVAEQRYPLLVLSHQDQADTFRRMCSRAVINTANAIEDFRRSVHTSVYDKRVPHNQDVLNQFVRSVDVMHLLKVLRGDSDKHTEAIEEVRGQRVLRMIGDYGSHFLYRHAQAVWGRSDWCRNIPRKALSNCLEAYSIQHLKHRYLPELKALALDVLLGCVHMPHRFSHTNIPSKRARTKCWRRMAWSKLYARKNSPVI